MKYILFFSLLIGFKSYSQWKTYTIGVKGDTLNRIDKKGLKQGAWVIKQAAVRGEGGYEEEGNFKDNLKEGPWRKFTLMGDLFAIESYRWGFKDGRSMYYDLNGSLTREESWLALDPEKKYDTIDVENVDAPNTFTRVVIKNEGSSLKHGNWKLYDAATGFISKTEFWHLGKKEETESSADKGNKKANADSGKVAAKKPKPKEVLDFEKKNSGRKKIKVRDGATF
jgi:antitoxin component YwqK of YwqJK toxin-antitoxin module